MVLQLSVAVLVLPTQQRGRRVFNPSLTVSERECAREGEVLHHDHEHVVVPAASACADQLGQQSRGPLLHACRSQTSVSLFLVCLFIFVVTAINVCFGAARPRRLT